MPLDNCSANHGTQLTSLTFCGFHFFDDRRKVVAVHILTHELLMATGHSLGNIFKGLDPVGKRFKIIMLRLIAATT